MLDYLKENKMFAAIMLCAVIGVGGYFAYSGGADSDQALTSTGAGTSAVNKELLATLGSLERIKLDVSIFSDPAFTQLVDFRVEIPTQPVGRENPFAPLGAGGTRTVPVR